MTGVQTCALPILSNSDSYDKGCVNCPPDNVLDNNPNEFMILNVPIIIVENLKTYNSKNEIVRDNTYNYNRLKFSKINRSLIGFSSVSEINNIYETINTKYFNTTSKAFYFSNLLMKEENFIFANNTNVLLDNKFYEYNMTYHSPTIVSYLEKVTHNDFINDVKTITENKPYYNENPTYRVETKLEKRYSSINCQESDYYSYDKQTNIYDKAIYCSWFKNQLVESKIERKHNDDNNTYVRNTEYRYNQNGNLNEIIKDSDVPEKTIISNIEIYNQFGLAEKVSMYAPNDASVESIVSETEYDTKGRFIIKNTNQLGFVQTYKYNDLGLLLESIEIGRAHV